MIERSWWYGNLEVWSLIRIEVVVAGGIVRLYSWQQIVVSLPPTITDYGGELTIARSVAGNECCTATLLKIVITYPI
jgi:hypothetical protein